MKIAKLNIEGYIGEIDEKSAFAGEKNFTLKNLQAFLNNLGSDVTDIHYKVKSGGGSVYEGWDIHDALIASGKKLTSIGEGIVGSIATVLFLAPKPENRKLIKGTKFFVHNPYWLPDAEEPMRASDLLSLGMDLKVEQDRILNFYAKESKADASELAPYLEKETDLTAENAVKMGFANEVIDEIEEAEYHQYRLVAMINPKQTNTDMKDEKFQAETTKKLNGFQKLLAKLVGKFLNMELKTVNGAGEEVNLVIESDTEDLTDKPCFIVDAEGNQVPAPTDEYKDAEGKVIKVTDGKVTEVVAKAEDNQVSEVDALKAEIETLKAEKEALNTSVLAKSEENESIKANVVEIEKEFKALKAVVIGEGASFDTTTQEFKARKSEPTVGSAFDHVAERLKNKNK